MSDYKKPIPPQSRTIAQDSDIPKAVNRVNKLVPAPTPIVPIIKKPENKK